MIEQPKYQVTKLYPVHILYHISAVVMASVSSKIFEIFRNLKSDAVPRAPRQKEAEPEPPRSPRAAPEARGVPRGPDTKDTPYNVKESEDESEHEEIIFNEDDFVKDDDYVKGEKQPKFKFPFHSKKGKGDPNGPGKPHKGDKKGSFSSVNTQATGPVFNIVNASGVQVGSNHVYYMSSTSGTNKTENSKQSDNIEKDNLITLLMESTCLPAHKYIHFIANNLGTNWKSFYVTLGYLKGRIDTMEMENGITEARYKLLREWVDNEEGTLGRLASMLWEEGERQIVRELSLIYKENKK